ncbi:MAG: ABC transporter permease [Coriobacteriales bacterium]|jgi:ABC-2 type transport system permease protein|nr:ABC transporter permease [Coriobacteriales bacterium]
MFELVKVSFFLNIREVRNIALMVLLPILLTLILGVSLSSVFNESNSNVLSASRWLYQIEDSASGEKLKEFLETYHTQLNMEVSEQANYDEAISSVSNSGVDGYLIYKNETITIYKNEHSSESTKWLEIVFDNYLDRASIIDGIVDSSQDLELLQFVQDNSMNIGNRIELLQIESTRQPNAIGYYAIAMITLTSCYSIVVMILGLSEERRKNTLKRFLLSGKSFFSFLLSKSISTCILLLAELFVVMIFDTFIYRVDFGDAKCWLTVLAVSVIFAFAVTQFGTLLSLLFKNLMALNIIVNAALLPIVLFFGGAYLHFYKLISMGLQNIMIFSPVYHVNKGLFDAIYLNSYEYIFKFCVLALIVSVLLAEINILLSRWRGNSWAQ